MLLKNSYQNSYAIDVPKSHWDIAKYRATLGHKANHSFKYFNSKYGMAYHPRYGSIRSIVAIRNIIKGEEILVDYLLGSRGEKVPEWYSNLYEHEVGKHWYNHQGGINMPDSALCNNMM